MVKKREINKGEDTFTKLDGSPMNWERNSVLKTQIHYVDCIGKVMIFLSLTKKTAK